MRSKERPGARRWAATVAVATIGAFGVLTAVASAAPATVADGHLDWGVKQSFRSYVESPIANGSITVSDGATRNADGTFRFPAATGSVDADADAATLAFGGTVAFSGHDGLLQVVLTDIRVSLTGSGGTLVADVTSKSLSTGAPVGYDDVVFADLADTDVTGTDTVVANGVATTLTAAGVPAFADFYAAGSALDPLGFAVSTPPAPVWEPAVSVSETSGVDPAGETLTVTGSGFDPAANVGARPPLQGASTGVYVVFAKISDPWRPSQGAPSANRVVLDQKWVLPAASRAILDPAGTNPAYAILAADGTFATTLDVAEVTEGKADCAVDTCAVITYGAGGAVNAAQETATVVTFADDETTPPSTTTTPTTTTAPPTGAVTDAALSWGVKESFRNYVAGPIAHGGWTVDGGVTDDDGIFTWSDLTGGDFTADGPAGTLPFGGSVRFTGHDMGQGPLLELTVANPEFVVADGVATLVADVRSKTLESGEFVDLPDVQLATLDLAAVTAVTADGVTTWADVPATLTEAGARAFAGFYEAGAALDPVTVAVAVDGAVLPGPGGTSTPAPSAPGGGAVGGGGGLALTGATLVPFSVFGGALLVIGAGLVLAQRRRTRA